MNKLTCVFNLFCMSVIFSTVLPMLDNQLDMQERETDLWQVIKCCYSSNMVAYYIALGADTTKLDNRGSCLLHGLIWANSYGRIDNVNDFVKKAEVLIRALPDKINALNDRGETPLDAAHVGLGTSRCMKYGTPEAFEKLITVYKNHGGKTAKELHKESLLS